MRLSRALAEKLHDLRLRDKLLAEGKITKAQLEAIGFRSKDATLYYDVGDWDYEYNIKTQELFSHCEVDGVTELITRVTSIEKLEELIELL